MHQTCETPHLSLTGKIWKTLLRGIHFEVNFLRPCSEEVLMQLNQLRLKRFQIGTTVQKFKKFKWTTRRFVGWASMLTIIFLGPKNRPSVGWIRCVLEGPVLKPTPASSSAALFQCRNTSTSHKPTSSWQWGPRTRKAPTPSPKFISI